MKPVLNVALKTALFASEKDQQDIARAAKVSPQKLSHVIHGRRSFDKKERERLASVLKKSVEELFEVAS